MTQKLISKFSSLSPEHISVAMVILSSQEIAQVYANSDKQKVLSKALGDIEK